MSEGTEKYTIADMVNEVETLLASFFENGHVNDEWRKEEPKRVNAYIARLKRFIGFESIPRTRFVRIFSRFQRVSISSFRPAVKPKPFDR